MTSQKNDDKMFSMDVSYNQINNNELEQNKNFCFRKMKIPNLVIFILAGIILSLIIAIIIISSNKSKSNVIDNNAPDQEINNRDKQKEKEEGSQEEIIEDKEEETQDEKEVERPEEEPKTGWEKYIKANKYLYIWEYYTPEYILNLCKEQHFTRVYLSIGCIETFWDDYYSKGVFPAKGEIGGLDYETFITKLNEINVEVELVTFLNRDANDFSTIDRAVKVANMVKELSKKVKIKALHFDQEPGDKSSYESLLLMYKQVNAIFPTSAILRPFWLRLKMSTLQTYFTDQSFYATFSGCETLVDAIMTVTKFSDLMAYNQDYDVVTGYMESLKTIAARHPDNEADNVFEIAFEAGVPSDDTLHARYVEDKDKFFTFIYDSSLKYGPITIHYYETWYKTLYCVWPSTKKPYEGGEPLDCGW